MHQAQQIGYRSYRYFVATEDPEINKRRVSWRVKNNGHAVPEEKIESRYFRSLELLLDAILVSNRAFLFDNSSDQQDKVWFAEITEGRDIEYKTDTVPAWFKRYVLEKI